MVLLTPQSRNCVTAPLQGSLWVDRSLQAVFENHCHCEGIYARGNPSPDTLSRGEGGPHSGGRGMAAEPTLE